MENNIRALREREGIKQIELARKLGIERSYLCNLEKGKRRPNMPLMIKLSSFLNCSLDDLAIECESKKSATEVVNESGSFQEIANLKEENAHLRHELDNLRMCFDLLLKNTKKR